MTPIKVAIVYTHFPHYRQAVFDALRHSGVLDVQFFYEVERNPDGVKHGMSRDGDVNLPSLSLGPVTVQRGFLRHAIAPAHDAYIFLGNPYIVSTWLYAALLRLRRRKVLFWTHGWLARDEGFKGRIRDVFYRLSDGLLVYGERARRIGIARGLPEDRIAVIYNSLDYDAQRRVRRPRAVDRARPFFLCVSRLVEATRIDLAVEALALLKGRGHEEVRLVVIGAGPERAALADLAARSGVEVEFTGPVYDEEVIATWMSRCIAVVSPGKVGLLAMHALAYGVPVVTHNDLDSQMPEVEALVPELTGFFARNGDSASLADSLELSMKLEHTDRAWETGIATVEDRYTAEAQTRRIEDYLRDLLGDVEA